MATITERLDSGEGDRDGLHGVKATRRFDVHLDEYLGEDINNPIAPIKDTYPPGSVHNVATGIYASDYTKVERVRDTRGRWIVEVLYEPPLIPEAGDWNGWQVDFDHSLQMEEVARDLDGLRIGGNAYREPKGSESASHEGDTIDGWIGLVQRSKAITPARLMRFMPTFAIRAARTVGVVTPGQYSRARGYRNTINETTFLAHRAGTVLASAPRITRRAGVMTGEVDLITPGTVYDVEINFLGNENGWETERLYDRWEWKGYEGDVRLVNKTDPVYHDHRMYNKADLNGLLSVFGGGAISKPPGRRGLP